MAKNISDRPEYNGQWNFHHAQQSQSTPGTPLPPPTPYSDRSFMHTWMAGAGLPLIQATITSCVIMAGTACFVWLIGGYEYARPVVAAGVATFVISWLALQFRWINLTRLEELTGIELDGKPGIGARTGSVRVQVDEVKENGHISVTKQFDLPATPGQLKALAIGMHDEGKTLAENEWSPLEAGKPFSLPQIRALKNEMKIRGLIVYANSKNKSLGYVETTVGRRVIESWKDLDDDE